MEERLIMGWNIRKIIGKFVKNNNLHELKRRLNNVFPFF